MREERLTTARLTYIEGSVETNTRNFLRSFAAFKSKARKGETIRVQDKAGEFIFTAAVARKSLLGAAKGKIRFADDLTKPTLAHHGWKPSL
jgi:hypothetical protein